MICFLNFSELILHLFKRMHNVQVLINFDALSKTIQLGRGLGVGAVIRQWWKFEKT